MEETKTCDDVTKDQSYEGSVYWSVNYGLELIRLTTLPSTTPQTKFRQMGNPIGSSISNVIFHIDIVFVHILKYVAKVVKILVICVF